jgi:hypothetical protein
MPQLDVGHRRICRDREGKVLQTWRKYGQSKVREGGEEVEERPAFPRVL